jgi:hypothetical protein
MKPKSATKAHEFLPVTPTEEEILRTMSTYRFMTALDVAYSLFSPKSLTHVRSILTRLSGGMDYKERECLYRFPWPTGKAGNPERIFTLGAAGREIVQRLGIPVTWYYRPSKTGRLNSSYLAHQLLVTRFVICACRFTSEQPDYTLADVRLCYDLERSLRNRAGEAVVPDAWLHFERVSDGGLGHLTVDTCGKPALPTLPTALKAQRLSAEGPRSSQESWCPTMAIRWA